MPHVFLALFSEASDAEDKSLRSISFSGKTEFCFQPHLISSAVYVFSDILDACYK